MLHDNSLADSSASQNYKWVKDSWASPNHPDVDHSADRSTFVRGALDTAKREDVRKMAKFLDDYRTPDQRRLAGTRMNDAAMIPQACSSPHSDSHILRPTQSIKPATPTLTHRTMSPTPTSTSMSWRKHSMRQLSASPFTSARDTTARTMHTEQHTLEPNFMDDGPSETNYQPTSVSHVEDSYWKNNQVRHEFQSEITPSPIKGHDQFYTAKQFPATVEISRTVDSLRIASPEVPPSPSIRKAISTASAASLVFDTKSSVPIEQSCLQSLPTNVAGLHAQVEDSRRSPSLCASERELELSKVDSQATSLQRAISNALKNESTSQSCQDGVQTMTLEESIAARYRHSIAQANTVRERSIEDTASRAPLTSFISKSGFATQVQDNSKSSQNSIGRDVQASKAQENSRSSLTELGHSKVAEMMMVLEEVTTECSRRGHMIDEMAKRIVVEDDVEVNMQQALSEAQSRSQALEQQLEMYKTQVDEMSENMRVLMQQIDCPREAVVPVVEDTRDNPDECEISPAQLLKSLEERNSLLDANKEEESLVDKVQRWESEVVIPTSRPQQESDIEHAIEKARSILKREPPSLQQANVSNTTLRDRSSYELPTPRAAQVANSTPTVVKGMTGIDFQKSLRSSRHMLQTTLADAEDQLKIPKSTTKLDNARIAPTRPLTADLMPDARDTTRCLHEKLYNRLQLGRIDDLSQTELSNLVKNILIQLDVPFDRAIPRIVEIGHALATRSDSQDVLWHEAIKLRDFAERIHGTLYSGTHIEGSITSSTCLKNMHYRVEKLQRALHRAEHKR